MPEASIGRIVHFVLSEGPSKGESRPAQIVAVFPQSEGPPLVNVVVTLDGLNDGFASSDEYRHSHREDGSPGYRAALSILHSWQTSVAHAEAVGSPPTYPPHTWHWPPGVS